MESDRVPLPAEEDVAYQGLLKQRKELGDRLAAAQADPSRSSQAADLSEQIAMVDGKLRVRLGELQLPKKSG